MWRLVARGFVLVLLLLIVPSVFAQSEFVAFLEKPQPGETVSGMVLVQGWAVDPKGVSRVDLVIDNVFQHSANLRIPRIDIVEAHPDWEGIHNRNPGFTTGFNAGRFTNGAHEIFLRILTEDGQVREVGRRTINVDNSLNQSPFGFVDTPDTVGIYDVNGSFPVSGWATDTDGIARVDVEIDGLTHQQGVYGDIRPDVGNAYPDFPAARFSAFIAQIDSTRIQDGVHVLTVRAYDRQGLSKVLGTRNIQVFNSTNNLRPFGFLDEPRRDATLYGNCSTTVPVISPAVNPLNPIIPVRGWALDLGTREDLGRISYVELLLDGAIMASSDDCAFVPEFGALVNCYGVPRYDVQKYYPTYPDVPLAGYFFAMDFGSLFRFQGIREGRHIIKIRVGDQEQTFADIPNTSGVPVTFQCIRQSDWNPIGFIDYPVNFDYLSGTVNFFGWALDDNTTVATVQIRIDGQVAGNAAYGFLRTDVQAAYPVFRNSLNSGWRFTMDTTQLGDGRHRLTVIAVNSRGETSEIGSADFFVDNIRP